MQKVQLRKKTLENDILVEGLTRPELAKKYDLSVGQINKALKMLELDNLRAGHVTFEIVADEEVVTSQVAKVEEVVEQEPPTGVPVEDTFTGVVIENED